MEEYPSPEAWMVYHREEYNFLFDDDDTIVEGLQPGSGQLNHLALCAIARHSDIKKRRYHPSSADTGLINREVHRILNACQDDYFGAHHNFLTDLASEDVFYTLKYITSRAISVWERGCRQYRRESPFVQLYTSHADIPLDTIDNEPIKLVLMASAALRHVVKQPYLKKAEDVGTPPWVRDVCLYGPQFTRVILRHLRAIRNPSSFFYTSRSTQEEFVLEKNLHDTTYAPEEVLFGRKAQASEIVLYLMDRAMLTEYQRELLWRCFEEGSEGVSFEVEQILNTLHHIAAEEGLL